VGGASVPPVGSGKHAPPAVVVLLYPQHGCRRAEISYLTRDRLAVQVEDDDFVA
jgi:hypothetical protein